MGKFVLTFCRASQFVACAMSKRIVSISATILIFLFGTSYPGVDSQQKITELEQEFIISSPETAFSRTACSFQKHNNIGFSYSPGWETGDRFATYFDIAAECGASPYPFEIQSIRFTLYDPGSFQWPVNMDVVVFDLAGTDSCGGPGDELCRFTITCDEATFGVPNFATVPFPTPCCVNGPVFIGFEYSDTGAGPFPSIVFDSNEPVPECENWAFGPTAW